MPSPKLEEVTFVTKRLYARDLSPTEIVLTRVALSPDLDDHDVLIAHRGGNKRWAGFVTCKKAGATNEWEARVFCIRGGHKGEKGERPFTPHDVTVTVVNPVGGETSQKPKDRVEVE